MKKIVRYLKEYWHMISVKVKSPEKLPVSKVIRRATNMSKVLSFIYLLTHTLQNMQEKLNQLHHYKQG